MIVMAGGRGKRGLATPESGMFVTLGISANGVRKERSTPPVNL